MSPRRRVKTRGQSPARFLSVRAEIEDYEYVASAHYRDAMADIHRHRRNGTTPLESKVGNWKDVQPEVLGSAWMRS